ncbi:hypothetical protein AbraIFM66950_010365 [Aspergillus brasiliensis]|nr:hypothetical protein AbraIFM66950_010365 [Aspergillus brasiliensis]
MSPIDGLHLDTSFPAGGIMNDLADMHMEYSGIRGLPVGYDPLPLIVPTISPAQDGVHANDLDLILSQLAAAVEAKLPQQDAAHLHEMRDLLNDSYNRLIEKVQHQIDTTEYPPHSPDSSDSPVSTHNGDKYNCLLCSKENRRIFKDRGNFRRHVSDQHHSEFRYLCLAHPRCTWWANRRDKVYYHMKVQHMYQVSREEIDRVAIRQKPPRKCGLCSKPVRCWADYFNCVAKHCRIKKVGSTKSSASQSRRGSDDRGGGNNGPGFGGPFSSGNSFGQFGPQQFNPDNNGSFFPPDFGQNNSHYGNSFSGYTGATDRDDDDSTSNYSCGEADAVSDEAPSSSCCPSDVSHAIDVPAPSSIITQHLALMQATPTERAESCDSVSHGETCLPSTPGDTDLRAGEEAHRRIPRPFGTADSTPKRNSRPMAEDRFEKRCQGCGHVFDDCDKCRRLQETSLQCHLCTDNACKVYASERNPQASGEPGSCKRTVDEGDHGVPGHSLWANHWSLSPIEHSVERSALDDYDRYTPSGKCAHLGAQKTSNGHSLGLEAAEDEGVHSGSKLMRIEEFTQALNMLSAANSTYQSYEILSFCVLNAVQDFFDQMLVSWLLCEAAVLHSVSMSYCIGESGILGERTESTISRRYFPRLWEKMRYQPTARPNPRRKHLQLRTTLQVTAGLLILRATVLKRKSMTSSSTDTSVEVAETSKVGTELHVIEPGVQVPPSLEAMFSRGTEVVADAFSSLITGVMSATEEEMDLLKPMSVHISSLFTRGSMWLGEESPIE